MVIALFIREFGRQLRHGAFLGAYIGADLYRQRVSLLNGLAREYRRRERTRERVTGTHGVGNLHLRCWLVALEIVRSENITAVGATGEHDHAQVVAMQYYAALLLDVKARIAKETAKDHEFLVVDLQDVAMANAILYGLLIVEIATEVDVENLQAILWRGVNEAHDGLLRLLTALRQ